MLDLITKNVFIARDVLFHETVFPFSTSATDFTDPFVLRVDTTIEGGLDTFVTPISIPDMPIDSCEPCILSDHTSFPSKLSTHDPLPSNSTIVSYFVLTIVKKPFCSSSAKKKVY